MVYIVFGDRWRAGICCLSRPVALPVGNLIAAFYSGYFNHQYFFQSSEAQVCLSKDTLALIIIMSMIINDEFLFGILSDGKYEFGPSSNNLLSIK
jgi:hypothetical protein